MGTLRFEWDGRKAEYDFRGAPRARIFDRYRDSGGTIHGGPVVTGPESDLQSLQGVGRKYGSLLQRSGFRSVADLVGVPAGAMKARLQTVNDRDRVVVRVPSVAVVAAWIRQASEQTPTALGAV